MAGNVLDFEPDVALFVPDNDPLRFYRAIAVYATRALSPGGTLLFEANSQYTTELTDLLCGLGFATSTVYDDRFGRPRFVETHRL